MMIRFCLTVTSRCLMLLSLGAAVQGCFLKTMDVAVNDGTTVKTEDGICHYVNPGSILHPVLICDQKDTVVLQVLKKRHRINKVQLEQEIARQLQSLVAATDIDAKMIGDATVEVWVSAPVLAPGNAHLVVVVKGVAMGFAVYLPAELRHWDFLSSQSVQLGASGYPSMQTWKTGRFLMAADRSIRNHDWQQMTQSLVASAGQTPVGTPRIRAAAFSGEGVVLETEQFSEAFVAKFVQNSVFGKKYKMRPVWIPAAEPDGYKARGHVFKLRIQG